MEISAGSMGLLFKNYQSVFNEALQSAQSHYKDVAMIVPSKTSAEVYGFLEKLPGMREWVGSRVINQLGANGFTIVNRDWEQTIELDRNDIEDDRYGLFAPLVRDMAVSGSSHPDELIFSLLGDGFTTKCYDGKSFFDTSHPVSIGDAKKGTYSNIFGSGKFAPWFLLDCSRPLRPLIFQERRKLQFVQKASPQDDNVFFDKRFLYGADARYNAGFGLPQLAFACTDPLTPYNYSVVRAAMMSQRAENGRPLGIRPTHLVTVPGNESAALRILRSETIEATTNEWAASATPIITQYLLGATGATAAWENVADFLNPNASYAAGSGTTADGKPPASTNG
ncbi:Mu-like prophage FluMu major head subunit [Gluconobacter thailandicus F149-1 = NBRC 100600]|uniref:Mu-like prophage major head subunit gpT n=1 Tax=Gluconobacter thailandicus NBRC 3257 TaxID=1381097 RepID=A0ABQ0IZG7_GLUTH|nr:Mu-like prophage major head subunit gpT family protein [Gluconobacter thailandicus]GAC89162.1 Mu-like prophage major head subunit gpT [Gluconobacter thailandicus NBRC 3255]GAD27578.1 Mu-like prophage major head subunit gpT [Gluconobacter thailandicus NBRC 3257]GAN94854.1 Mu-like prophage FluMu major head subunit [Gluconobacter thailandicus F149-1 = NBRC 100600]GBR60209.1 Mu-like prophage major head subunit gpT [Gluconobacter thailandicus F149-1 = NBRC 100600]GEL88353.1 head protein [Glucono